MPTAPPIPVGLIDGYRAQNDGRVLARPHGLVPITSVRIPRADGIRLRGQVPRAQARTADNPLIETDISATTRAGYGTRAPSAAETSRAARTTIGASRATWARPRSTLSPQTLSAPTGSPRRSVTTAPT